MKKTERRKQLTGQLKRIDRTPTLRSRLLVPVRRLKRTGGWVPTHDLLKIVPGVLRRHAGSRADATGVNDVLRDAVSRGLVERVFGYSRLTTRGRRVA